MTLNVCVFGNSHLAAVKDGHTKFGDRWPELNCTFVGAHKAGLAETICENGILRPLSDGAKEDFARLANLEAVDLRKTDAIVIVGAGFAPMRSALLYHKARWADLPSVKANPDPSPDWFLVSKPAFSAMLQAKLVAEPATRFIQILRRDIDKPIFVVSQPRLTTRIMDIGQHRLDIVRSAVNAGDAAALSALYEANAYTLCDALGVTYLAQNPNTITQDLLTADPYTKGAIRLAKLGRFTQPKEDVLHANATYGKIVLDQVRAACVRERLL